MFGFKKSMVQAAIILTWALEYYTFGNLFIWWTFSILLCFVVILGITTYDHDYWSERGVFSPPAWPVVGHILPVVMFKEQGGMCFKRIYETYRNERFLGTHQFYQRTLVICDPELIKRICVVDFQHFVDRGFFFNKDVDPLAGSVLFLRGNEWKRLRAKISPIFSPNKLRGMFPLIDNTANEFVIQVKNLLTKASVEKNNISEQNENKLKTDLNKQHDLNENGNNENSIKVNGVKENGVASNGVTQNGKYTEKYANENAENKTGNNKDISAVVDSEKLVGGYTADAIVPCAFGLKSGVMYNDKDPFAVALQAFYEMSVFNIFEKTMRQFWPAFVLFFRMRIIPKKTHDFFYNIVTSVLRAREKGEQEKRGDFIDMMMALRSDDNNNNSKADGDDVEITDMVISANAFIIFLGGFETTSSTLAFLCLELAAHPQVQEKMREEVLQALERRGGNTSYEMLQELTYMEMVIQETLRLYPPFPSIQRMCTKDYVIPDTSVVVERGTIVLFPTLGIQRDEQYFEDADCFIPERWSEGRPQPPPGVYMPFGDGPRYCIGKRFAMLQMKCCLVRLLQLVRIGPVHARAAQRAGERVERAGERVERAGERVERAGERIERTGERVERAAGRPAPFPPDPRSPLTLHPADSLVRLTLL